MSASVPTTAQLPEWWPNAPAFTLLDARNGVCRLSSWSAKTGLQQWSEPAYVRFTSEARPLSWGNRAAAWVGRAAGSRVRLAFTDGWPSDTVTARWYLSRLTESCLPPKTRHRVWITEDSERRWTRRLWHESLEDSAFTVGGFLAPWQHELILETVERPELALGNRLHVELERQALVWNFLAGGRRLGGGRDPRLSETGLLLSVAEYARRYLSVECAEETLRALLVSATRAETGRRPESLSGQIEGRQLSSGLPIRLGFSWLEFLSAEARISENWLSIKSQLAAQAEECCQVRLEEGPGLGLPGWRVLLGGELTPILVEAAVSRLLERKP